MPLVNFASQSAPGAVYEAWISWAKRRLQAEGDAWLDGRMQLLLQEHDEARAQHSAQINNKVGACSASSSSYTVVLVRAGKCMHHLGLMGADQHRSMHQRKHHHVRHPLLRQHWPPWLSDYVWCNCCLLMCDARLAAGLRPALKHRRPYQPL